MHHRILADACVGTPLADFALVRIRQCFRLCIGECCVLAREQKHPDDFVSDAPDEDASAGVQSSPWVFPFVPVAGASEESNLQCQKIIAQCQLVCPLTSSKHEKRQMVRRLGVNWHPDKAALMQRDSKMCQEVFAFLNELRERSSML